MQHYLSAIPYPDKDESVVTGPDPLIVGSSAHVLGKTELLLDRTVHPAKRRKTKKIEPKKAESKA